jgi:hypothetical protein
VIPRLRPIEAPAALGSWLILRPSQVLAREAVPGLQVVEPRGEPLGTSRHRLVGPLLAWHLVLLGGNPTASPFLLRISRLKCASDLGSGIGLAPPPAIPLRARPALPPRASPTRRLSHFRRPFCELGTTVPQ